MKGVSALALMVSLRQFHLKARTPHNWVERDILNYLKLDRQGWGTTLAVRFLIDLKEGALQNAFRVIASAAEQSLTA